MRDILWQGIHQRGSLGEISMSLRGLSRFDVLNIKVAMRRAVDAPLEYYFEMLDDPLYDDDIPYKLLDSFVFYDNELVIYLDKKEAPIGASTLPIFVGAQGILGLEIGVRAQTSAGEVPLLRGRIYLDGGVIASPIDSGAGAVRAALIEAMKKSIANDVLLRLPRSMTAENFVIDESFIASGCAFTLAQAAEHEPLAVHVPGVTYQGNSYRIDADNPRLLHIQENLLQMSKYIAQAQIRQVGGNMNDWSLTAVVSYRPKKRLST